MRNAAKLLACVDRNASAVGGRGAAPLRNSLYIRGPYPKFVLDHSASRAFRSEGGIPIDGDGVEGVKVEVSMFPRAVKYLTEVEGVFLYPAGVMFSCGCFDRVHQGHVPHMQDRGLDLWIFAAVGGKRPKMSAHGVLQAIKVKYDAANVSEDLIVARRRPGSESGSHGCDLVR